MFFKEFKNRIQSFSYAFNGIREMFSNHKNFKIQLFFGCLAIILGIVLEINKAEWIAIVFCIGMVLALETVNSAIELIVDFISPDFHPIAGKIKDLSAAAVLIISIISAIIGLVIILPYLI